MKKTFFFLALCLTLVFSASLVLAKTKYNVYCANGKIEVDMRDLKQMQSARGSNTCLLKSFDYKMDADKYAKSLGGVGAKCSCK